MTSILDLQAWGKLNLVFGMLLTVFIGKKDDLGPRTKSSFYVSSKINAHNNPDILFGKSHLGNCLIGEIGGMKGLAIIPGNKYFSKFYDLAEGEGDDKDENADA